MEKLILIGLGIVAYLYATQTDEQPNETPMPNTQPAANAINEPTAGGTGANDAVHPIYREPVQDTGFNPLQSLQDHINWVYSIPVPSVQMPLGVIDARDYDDDPLNDTFLGGTALMLMD